MGNNCRRSSVAAPAIPSTRHNSTTAAPEFRVVKDIDELSPVVEAESSIIDLTKRKTDKRPLASGGADSIAPRKKAKRTSQLDLKSLGPSAYKPIKKNIFLREIGEQECIFSYGDYAGFYVLRCNQVKCKKELSLSEATIFTSHPFWDALALQHFSEEWHGLTSEDEVFRKFAIRVIDADSERNTDNRNAQESEGDFTGEGLSYQKKGSLKKRAYGKWPERWYNSSEPMTPAAEASTSESATHSNETFKESFYRAGTLLSIAESTSLDGEGSRSSPKLGTTPQADAE
ncbi:hypothetical protein NPX13_g9944 [Xylaria arbuscula]|uniref:Uncharacterized protein n=1 Tax=Xylaria arbuscula TaxID=114810 RepID=A0A9W8N5Z8_9PEZI|nr:hypothetical protein NPX13_g9944 [Xylaria arbuscula]